MVVRTAHHQTPWESRLALVELKIDNTLGYKIAPWAMWFGSHAAEIWPNKNNNTMERVFSLLNCWHSGVWTKSHDPGGDLVAKSIF